MNETIKNISERRSVREYKPEMIPEDVLDRIINAGTYAASGMGKQSPIIIAITDREIRDRLSKLNAQVMGEDMDPFYGAPVVMAVLADRSSSTYLYDGSLTIGNMMIAAQSEGIASCWVHRAREVFTTDEAKQLITSLGIQGDYEGIGFCILGYSAEPHQNPAPRKTGYVHFVK